MGFLTDKEAEVRRLLLERPLEVSELTQELATTSPALDFVGALATPLVSVIAEVKRSSPSVGAISADTDPVAQARAYEEGGAAVISVLTESAHFGGSLDDLRAVRSTVSVPVLRKDFLLEPVQLLEARAAGADAVLLITASLSPGRLQEMQAAAQDLGLGTLLETHSAGDLEKALATDAPVVGVNARDLETLEVDVDRAFGMLAEIPGDRIAVLESGITSRHQVVLAADSGARAVLVGEALMRSGDPAAKIAELLGGEG